MKMLPTRIIKYIPLQQGLRHKNKKGTQPKLCIIKYIPLQQGLRLTLFFFVIKLLSLLLSIFHYNKD